MTRGRGYGTRFAGPSGEGILARRADQDASHHMEATGEHVIEATARDFAGNETTRSVTVTVAEADPLR